MRMVKHITLMITLATFPGLGHGESLKDALRSAYEHSGLLQQNRALLRAADENVAQAVAGLRPVVSWVANAQYARSQTGVLNTGGDSAVRSSNLTVQAEWLLYDFGRTSLQTEVLKETVLATRAQLIAIEQNVLLDAAVAYMNLHRAIQAQSLRASNVNLIKEQLRAAQDRFDVGEVTRTDVATAEARLAAAKSQLAQANGDRTRAAAEFQRAVGRKPGAVRAPGRLPRISSNVNSAIHTARQGHPDLQAIQHQIKAAELTVEGAKLARMPQVTLNSSATIDNTPGNGLQTQLGLRASGVLYSGGAISSQIRAAMAQRDATRAALHSTQHLIDQSVQNAYVLLNVARASGTAGDEQIRASEVAFKGIQEEALLGARTTLDVLNAEQELLDARNSRISAGVDEQIAAYTILAATGQLTAQALNLGVTIYDPTEYYNLVRTAPTSRSVQGKALDRVLKSIGQ